jgi:hypothetical protein
LRPLITHFTHLLPFRPRHGTASASEEGPSGKRIGQGRWRPLVGGWRGARAAAASFRMACVGLFSGSVAAVLLNPSGIRAAAKFGGSRAVVLFTSTLEQNVPFPLFFYTKYKWLGQQSRLERMARARVNHWLQVYQRVPYVVCGCGPWPRQLTSAAAPRRRLRSQSRSRGEWHHGCRSTSGRHAWPPPSLRLPRWCSSQPSGRRHHAALAHFEPLPHRPRLKRTVLVLLGRVAHRCRPAGSLLRCL